MPFRAPTLCSCGRIVSPLTRCPCKVAADRAREKAHDAKRGSARSRGYDSKWDRERAAFLALHPTCSFCPASSSVVDHKTPHRGDMKLFWDRKNWQPLCSHCHSSTKQAHEKASRR